MHELGYDLGENLFKLVALMDQRHADLKEIAALRLAGHTVPEIARQLDTAVRTVERRLEWIKEIWQNNRNEQC